MNQHFERVGVYQYPNRYIVVTIHTLKQGGGVRSNEISIFDRNVSEEILATSVLQHLSLSKANVEGFDLKDANMKYHKVTGIKTIKAEMKDSKYISVNKKNEILTISSSKNGGTSGYNKGFNFFEEKIELVLPKSNLEIGAKIIDALKKSE